MCLAVPGKLVSITEPEDVSGDPTLFKMGKVSFGGVLKDVSLAYVPEATVGDYVIVHVGFALSVVDAQEAEETLNILSQVS